MLGESTYSYIVAMTSCEANNFGILSCISANIHTITDGNSVLSVFFLIDYMISSHSGS